MRKVPKTFTISPSSVKILERESTIKNRTASNIVDGLIMVMNAKHGSCEFCGSKMTEDELFTYKTMCFKCCSKAWKAYEIAHGGVCSEDTKKRHVTKSMKADVLNRDHNKCLKCGSIENLTVDHITPLSRGGDNDYSNLQTLCSFCNSAKGVNIEDCREVI